MKMKYFVVDAHLLRNDPHIHRLAELLQIDESHAVGIVCELYAWAAINAPSGKIPNNQSSMIDQYVRYNRSSIDIYNALLESGYIAETKSGDIRIAYWGDRCGTYVNVFPGEDVSEKMEHLKRCKTAEEEARWEKRY